MIILHEELANKLIIALNDTDLSFNGKMLTLLAALENVTIQQSKEQSEHLMQTIFYGQIKILRESLLSNIT